MRFWPRSLFGQILLTLLLGLLFTQLMGAFLVWHERSDFAARITGFHAAERIGGIVTLLENSRPEDRLALVSALSVPPLKIELDQPWASRTESPSPDTEFFLRQLSAALDKPYLVQAATVSQEITRRNAGNDTKRTSTMGHHRGGEMGRNNEMSGRRMRGRERHDTAISDISPTDSSEQRSPPTPPTIRVVQMAWVQVRLTDGQVITFKHLISKEPIDWPSQIFMLFIVLGISIALLSAWVVRYLTKPLRILSNAATGLGKNIHQRPLPEKGPNEVVTAARAFNTMQKDIVRYLETRSQTLAALSHDLRLPITRIRLRIETLMDQALKDKLVEDLEEIDTMIDNTLAFLRAGKSTEEIRPIDINAMLDSIVDDMTALGATINMAGRASTPVFAQPQALRRSLNNLLDNARRYGDSAPIDVVISETEAVIILSIQDRGPGIHDANKEKVFEPYVRLETSRAKHTGGSGLGLATARTTIRSYGGDIVLKDREEGGLIVEICLPKKANKKANKKTTKE